METLTVGIRRRRSPLNFLDEGRVEGVFDPVAQYGGRSREALIRLDTLEHCPDISVSSLYDPAFEEVAAFEELIGSHGGLGGIQTLPLLLRIPRSGPWMRSSSEHQPSTGNDPPLG